MNQPYARDPILSGTLAYWERQRGGRAMPRRADLNPADIPRLLPNLRLTEVIDGGARFRYRLVGTAIVTAYGREHTGRFLHDVLSGERRSFVEGLYRMVCAGKRPVYARTYYIGPWELPVLTSRVMVPLSENDADVNLVMTAISFDGNGGALTIGLAGALDLERSSVAQL